MTPQERAQIERGFQALGVSPAELQQVLQQPSFAECQVYLEALKDKVRKSFKKLAFELHPDRTGNDPEKTELFKVVARIRDDVEKLTLQEAQLLPPPPPMPIPFIVIEIQNFNGFGRPPPWHPAANGRMRTGPLGPNSVTQTVVMYPTGVHPKRGT